MAKDIPKSLEYFFENAYTDLDDGYEFASELNRILNSDTCQHLLTQLEINKLRTFADKVKDVGEMNYYTEIKIKEIETEMFGDKGIEGFLKTQKKIDNKKSFDDLFND